MSQPECGAMIGGWAHVAITSAPECRWIK